jgi:D-amino-acid oxidase
VRVIVLGAGVTGLSCAVRLAESGHQVAVLARDLPAETTSAVAAAIWYPYLISPPERVSAWSRATYQELARLAAEQPFIRLRGGSEYLVERTPDPWWADAVPDLRRIQHPPPGFADGWSFTTVVVEMTRYLPYLARRLDAAGGTLSRATVDALPNTADVVVNCTGLGARKLLGDHNLTSVRGQVVYVEQFGLTEWMIADQGPERLSYVVPRERDVVVGGTSQVGEWSRVPDPVAAQDMLRRAAGLVPGLANARVLGHRVGLRPSRPEIRCEAARSEGRTIVHCYGHGGAGLTVSWGCAGEVAELVKTAAARP